MRGNLVRVWAVGLLPALLLPVLTACTEPETPPRPLRIGLIVPQVGQLDFAVGEPGRLAATLAVQEVNARGGVKIGDIRRPVVLHVENNEDRPEVAVQVARRLINQEQVVALVGPFLSRNALAVAHVAENLATPMISPTATHPELTTDRQYVFQASTDNDIQGRALAKFARDELQARNAAVLFDVASAYNRSLAEIFRQSFLALGGERVTFESYVTGEEDFRPQLERLAPVDPDVLLLPNYNLEVPSQAQIARELGLRAVFLGGDTWNQALYPPIPSLTGSYFVNQWHPDAQNEASRSFVDRCEKGLQRTPTSIMALAYDSVGLILGALEAAGSTDGPSVRQALAGLQDFPAVTGRFSFRDRGAPIKEVQLIHIQDFQAILHRTIAPDQLPPPVPSGEQP